VSRIREKTFYLQFCMGTPEGHQKSIFKTPKGKEKDTYGIYPTKFASSTQKHKKVIETPNLPIRTKNFPKIYVSSLKSVKEPKIHMGATRRNLQAQLKILNKSWKPQINQSERKFSQKN
jgi:hypothetical protein